MCKKCSQFINRLIEEKGMTEEEAINFLWEQTAFPFEAPDVNIVESIKH